MGQKPLEKVFWDEHIGIQEVNTYLAKKTLRERGVNIKEIQERERQKHIAK